MLQNRKTTVSTIIPLYRLIIRELEKNRNFQEVTNTISNGLKERMAEKIARDGRIKREAWNNNRDLVLSTILDPCFKLVFLEQSKHEEYKNWLIAECETNVEKEVCL